MDTSLGLTPFLGDQYINTEASYSLQYNWFPCLLVLSGSGNAVLKVCRELRLKVQSHQRNIGTEWLSTGILN